MTVRNSETDGRVQTDATVRKICETVPCKLADSAPIAPQHPRVGEQNLIEHAMQMMDGYNRLFLRTFRQLRDLRRYSTPITINNPRQVNIAADGGQ
jgi:hypothetical protein